MVTFEEMELLWSVIGKIGVAIALIVGLIKGIDYLIGLMPVSKLEIKVKANSDKIKTNEEHLKKIDNKIELIENKIEETERNVSSIDEGVRRIGESQISLLHHFVNGNGQKEMEHEADKLIEFFMRKGD